MQVQFPFLSQGCREHMIEALPPSSLAALILLTFIFAGVVKGAFGIGFPSVAMSILPFFIEPALAVTLLAMPIVLLNFQQMISIKGWQLIARRFWPAGLAAAATVLLVSQVLDDVPSQFISICVGIALTIFALTGLFRLDLPVNDGLRWQLGVGIGTGIIGGLTAIKAPILIYSIAMRLPRDTFVAMTGFLLFCGGAGLLAGVSIGSMYNSFLLLISAAAVAISVVGFRLGEAIRNRLQPELFRKLVLWLLLILGIRIILVNLF